MFKIGVPHADKRNTMEKLRVLKSVQPGDEADPRPWGQAEIRKPPAPDTAPAHAKGNTWGDSAEASAGEIPGRRGVQALVTWVSVTVGVQVALFGSGRLAWLGAGMCAGSLLPRVAEWLGRRADSTRVATQEAATRYGNVISLDGFRARTPARAAAVR